MHFENYNRYLPPSDPLAQRLEKFETINGELEGLYAFSSTMGVMPRVLVRPIFDKISQFSNVETPHRESPYEQLLEHEMLRKTHVRAQLLEQGIKGTSLNFVEMMDVYGIEMSEFKKLETWLTENKPVIEETIRQLSHTYNYTQMRDVPFDVTNRRRKAEELVQQHIEQYHPQISEMFNRMWGTPVTPSAPIEVTTRSRSYYSPLLNYVGLSLSALCNINSEYLQDGSVNNRLSIDVIHMLELFGHEFIAHAMHQHITDMNELPTVLQSSSTATIASQEAIAQYFETELLVRLQEYPDIISKLGIDQDYQKMLDRYLKEVKVHEYIRRMQHFTRYVVADPLGRFGTDSQNKNTIEEKKELLRSLSLDPYSAGRNVENMRKGFNSKGELDPEIVSELRYFPNPVQQIQELGALYGIAYEGYVNKMIIDKLLLGSGYWTPRGLVKYVNLELSQISGKDLIDIDAHFGWNNPDDTYPPVNTPKKISIPPNKTSLLDPFAW